MRSLVLVAFALAGCSRCGARAAAVDASDAAVEAGPLEAGVTETSKPKPDELALRPVAFSRNNSSLHRLADGTIAFAHHAFVDRLAPDGTRTNVVRMPFPFMDIGTVAGVADDFWVSDIWVDYPASHGSDTWRVGADRTPKRDLLGGKDSFYVRIAPWKDGRLLGYRGSGSITAWSTNVPWIQEGFAVARGPAAALPKIPKPYYVEDMIAFPSGTVIAAASRYEPPAMAWRKNTFALRWDSGATEPTITPLPEDAEGIAEHIAARSEDDVWIGGQAPSFMHWDGKAWGRVSAEPVAGGIRSMAVAADGALWVVDGERKLSRRAADGTWTAFELPELHTDFGTNPRIYWLNAELAISRDRDIAFSAKATEVVASGTDVWVKGETTEDMHTGSVLFHWSREKEGAGPVADLDLEDSRGLSDVLERLKKDCHVFLSAGPATETALNRVRAAPLRAVVIARLKGERVVGSSFTADQGEMADEQAMKWRNLGLPVEMVCGHPPLESLVVDPEAPAHDE